MSLLRDAHEKIQSARLVVITSVVIALALNLLANFTSYPGVITIVFVLFIIAAVFIAIQLADVQTEGICEVGTSIVYDSKAGEITDYPSHITQDIVRQAVRVLSKYDANVIERIKNPPFFTNPASRERSVFADIAELILLRQISSLLMLIPSDYEKDFKKIDKLPSGFLENPIINPLVTTLKKERDVIISAINNLDEFYIPKSCSLTVGQNPRYVHPDYRQFILNNGLIKITINCHPSGNVTLSSMTSGTPVPEIGHIPINPYFYADAMKRFSERRLRIATFYYYVHAELLRPKICLFLMFFKIPPWNRKIRNSLDFIDYVVKNFSRTPFGSIEVDDNIEKERVYWEHRFTMETLWRMKLFLDEYEKKKQDKNES
jgi:hypothetical protein